MSYLTRTWSPPLRKGVLSSPAFASLLCLCVLYKCRMQPNSPVPAMGSVAWVSALALVNGTENWASLWGSAGSRELSSPVFLCMNLVPEKSEMVPCASHHAHQNPEPQNEQSCFYLCQRWLWQHRQSQWNEEKNILYFCTLTFSMYQLMYFSVDKDRLSFRVMSSVSISTKEGNKTGVWVLKDANKFLEYKGNHVASVGADKWFSMCIVNGDT